MRKKDKDKESHKPKATDYCCPICDKPLYMAYGDQTHPGQREHGIVLFCIHGDPNARKHPQEVAGHGNFKRVDEKDEACLARAYGIIRAKFCGAKLDNESEIEEITVEG